MPAEITTTFSPEARLKHVDEVALAGGILEGTFDTKDYGTVTMQRGNDQRPGFLAQSEGFNVSVIVDTEGDQSAILTYGFTQIITTSDEQIAELREQVDKMLKQCNNATRR